MPSFSFKLWALAMKTTVVRHRVLREREAFKRYFSELINLLQNNVITVAANTQH